MVFLMKDFIIVKNKYKLGPVKIIEQDDIQECLSSENGIYVCSLPESNWCVEYGLELVKNFSIKKKLKMFSLMGVGSIIVSPTDIDIPILTPREIRNGKLIHLSSRFINKRLKQLEYTFKIIIETYRLRKQMKYVLYYNFGMPVFFSALFAKYVLGLKVYVDFEDDYTLLRGSGLKNFVNNLMYKVPDIVICINKHMKKHFTSKTQCFVYNAFIDLGFANSLDFRFKEGTTFLFAATLDEIRGADLLPYVVLELRKQIKSFKLIVTGTGPLEGFVSGLSIPELEYFGFLAESAFENILNSCDAFLILQKPDHPFSGGSFPSKIEYYSSFKKPIYSLEMWTAN